MIPQASPEVAPFFGFFQVTSPPDLLIMFLLSKAELLIVRQVPFNKSAFRNQDLSSFGGYPFSWIILNSSQFVDP